MKLILFFIIIFKNLIFANTYPSKNINIIVPFGKGGSVDFMVRTMQPFLEDELKQKINIINIVGQEKNLINTSFLQLPADGYNILATSFSPFLINNIISSNNLDTLNNFDILNIQWFDFDFIGTRINSKLETLTDLINFISTSEKPIKVALVKMSSGHLLIKLLIKEFNISKHKIEYVYFDSGKLARDSIVNNKTDFIVISAQGTEKYKEFIKPIVVLKEIRSNKWDAPTINDELIKTKIKIPILKGSMRGFAVSRELKIVYPNRYSYIEESFKKVLAKKEVQKILKKNKIGYMWIGSDRSNTMFQESFEIFKNYYYFYEN